MSGMLGEQTWSMIDGVRKHTMRNSTVVTKHVRAICVLSHMCYLIFLSLVFRLFVDAPSSATRLVTSEEKARKAGVRAVAHLSKEE